MENLLALPETLLALQAEEHSTRFQNLYLRDLLSVKKETGRTSAIHWRRSKAAELFWAKNFHRVRCTASRELRRFKI